VVGTPGVGKTTFCESLATATGMTHVEVAKAISTWKLYREWDDELNCSIFDKDLVLDHLEADFDRGNKIFDFHSCDFFPIDSVDCVVVLRAETHVLYDRLKLRNYSDKKIQQNVDCEIFQVLLDEARETFDEAIVVELSSNTLDDLERNVEDITEKIKHLQ